MGEKRVCEARGKETFNTSKVQAEQCRASSRRKKVSLVP
jgi:hypothetical protein